MMLHWASLLSIGILHIHEISFIMYRVIILMDLIVYAGNISEGTGGAAFLGPPVWPGLSPLP